MDTIKGLKERYEAIGNIEELLEIMAPDCTDPKKYYKNYIEKEPNYEVARKRVLLLEHLSKIDELEKTQVDLEALRKERDLALKNSDWTQLADNPLSSDDRKLYRKYRFYLRNLPDMYKNNTKGAKVMSYTEWIGWIKEIRYLPGFSRFLP